MAAMVDKEKCTTCGACVEVCPGQAITLNDVAQIDNDKCLECGTCITVCPGGAITLERAFAFPAPRARYPAGRYPWEPPQTAVCRGSLGWGRGRGRGFGKGQTACKVSVPPHLPGQGYYSSMPKAEKAFLKERLSFLKQKIEAIDNRLKELEKGRR